MAVSRSHVRRPDGFRRGSLQDLGGSANIAAQLQALDASLQQRVRQSESRAGYEPAREGAAMSFEQKRRLSIMLGQLPGDRISDVMRIISEDESMRQKVG